MRALLISAEWLLLAICTQRAQAAEARAEQAEYLAAQAESQIREAEDVAGER